MNWLEERLTMEAWIRTIRDKSDLFTPAEAALAKRLRLCLNHIDELEGKPMSKDLILADMTD